MKESTLNNTPIDRWGVVRNWLEDNQADIVLVAGIIFVALISFGLGILMAPKAVREPVAIESNMAEVVVSDNLAQAAGQNIAESASSGAGGNQLEQRASSEKGMIVASKNGTKYYWPWSSWAKRIKPENQVWFNSEAKAKAAGFAPNSTFAKEAPVGYSAQ